jgi:hypothetical protein
LLRSATEAVRARLLSQAPPHLFEETERDRGRRRKRDREMSRTRVSPLPAACRSARKHGKLGEPALLAFAKGGNTPRRLPRWPGVRLDHRCDPPRQRAATTAC